MENLNPQPEKKTYSLGENNIFVEHLIPKEKTFNHPLLFVHGSFGGAFVWQQLTSYLSQRGFECFALSLRGHKPSGEVDLSKVSMGDYIDDVALVVNELKLENPVIIGHSSSGLLVLMYAAKNKVRAVVSIDPSPSLEIQGSADEETVKKIPLVYSPIDAGMPTDPAEMMKAIPDLSQEMLMKLKEMLGMESGLARRDRKRGISVPKEALTSPLLFFGAELGDSLPFGISFEKSQKMAGYYGGELIEIKGATHPGILMGEHTQEVAEKIEAWLKK